MALKLTKGNESIVVENDLKLVEAALAMAEVNRKWSYGESTIDMEKRFTSVVESMKTDPTVTTEELESITTATERTLLLEELALTFRAIQDEADDLLPSFEGSQEEALAMLKAYGISLGVTLSLA